jgi:phosphate:Na+ symporter
VAIGLGLMLMALAQLIVLVTPYEDAPSMRMVLGAVATQPVMDVLLAAGLTWAAHSSVAVVLLVMSFAAKGAVPPEAAFALVLGANLGTAINPVLEGVSGDDPVARRLPIGNLLNRLIGVVVVLALLPRLAPLWVALDPDPVREVADFHTVFNLLLAVIFLPLLGPWAALLRRLLPARVEPDDPGQPRYLEPAALETPPIALAAAAREDAERCGQGDDRHRSPPHRQGAPAAQHSGQAE